MLPTCFSGMLALVAIYQDVPSAHVACGTHDAFKSRLSLNFFNYITHLPRTTSNLLWVLCSAGDMFGEMALMRKQRRSATVVCSTLPRNGSEPDKDQAGESFCVVNEIKGEDFMRMLEQSESFLKSMNVILRTRMFR